MFEPTTSIPFEGDDLELLTVEAISIQLRASRAFVRLCISCGCPTRCGRLSAAELLHWLFDHYAEVRALSGLKPLAEVDGVEPKEQRRLRMANGLYTLLDFGESRASELWAKRELQKVCQIVERSLERI
jgi:hypothetical protein